MRRWSKTKYLQYGSPFPKLIILGVVVILLAILTKILEVIALRFAQLIHLRVTIDFSKVIFLLVGISIMLIFIAILESMTRSDTRAIKYFVRKRLCDSRLGNPLHLVEGELEPSITVFKDVMGFRIRIECHSVKLDVLSELKTVISECLRGKYTNYAVVRTEEDLAGKYVDYYIEDVISNYNKQSIYLSLDDVRVDYTKLYIREDTYIDYKNVLNSSAIIAGRSRSGKTTAIISVFLLPILKNGRDEFGSRVVIIDPKSAELSLCPYVLSPKSDGSVEHILDAIIDFNRNRVMRQKIINDYCDKYGKSVKWFDIGMKPCILFLDEFVSIQDMFPKKAPKDRPDYSLSELQGLLRQIATQGASAGCFLILSTAEASVGTGGLESAINNACGIRILFKPSLNEARYLWSSDALEVVRERVYSAGDAWFSADDGINNSIRFVKFPQLKFSEYDALSKLLRLYYEEEKDTAL
jgi:hypothetical protein